MAGAKQQDRRPALAISLAPLRPGVVADAGGDLSPDAAIFQPAFEDHRALLFGGRETLYLRQVPGVERLDEDFDAAAAALAKIWPERLIEQARRRLAGG